MMPSCGLTITESFFQAANWLDICGRHGITLNPDKFTFAQGYVALWGCAILVATPWGDESGEVSGIKVKGYTMVTIPCVEDGFFLSLGDQLCLM